jgi:hypothetical protein
MSISELFIRRPVMTTLLMLSILMFGIWLHQAPGQRSAQHRLSRPGDGRLPDANNHMATAVATP